MATAAQNRQAHDALAKVAYLKQYAKEVSQMLIEAEADLVDIMDGAGLGTSSVDLDTGGTVKGTLVKAERVVYDAEKMEKALGAKMWAKVTKRVMDKGLLEAHVATKDIDPNVVAACSEVVVNKPYVRFSGDTSNLDLRVQPPNVPTLVKGKVTTKSSTGRVKPAARPRAAIKP